MPVRSHQALAQRASCVAGERSSGFAQDTDRCSRARLREASGGEEGLPSSLAPDVEPHHTALVAHGLHVKLIPEGCPVALVVENAHAATVASAERLPDEVHRGVRCASPLKEVAVSSQHVRLLVLRQLEKPLHMWAQRRHMSAARTPSTRHAGDHEQCPTARCEAWCACSVGTRDLSWRGRSLVCVAVPCAKPSAQLRTRRRSAGGL